MNHADPDSAKLSLSLESHEVSERVAEVMIEFARFRAQEGIFTKPSVMAAARRLPPLSWWRTFGAHMPSLQACWATFSELCPKRKKQRKIPLRAELPAVVIK